MPVSVQNLNIIRRRTEKMLDVLFVPNRHVFGTEIDVVLAVTYCYKQTPYKLNLVYQSEKGDNLSQMAHGIEQNPHILKLCEQTLLFVLDHTHDYKMRTNSVRMERRVKSYMAYVQTKSNVANAMQNLKDLQNTINWENDCQQTFDELQELLHQKQRLLQRQGDAENGAELVEVMSAINDWGKLAGWC